MNLIAFEIPESQSDTPTWLESVLCEGELRGLVAQLSAFAGQSDHDESSVLADLDVVIGNHRQAMLRDGLSALPYDAITSLLRKPSQLLALQQLTMSQGGEFWRTRYSSDAGIAEQLGVVRQQTDDAMGQPSDSSRPSVTTPPLHAESGQPTNGRSLLWLLALAAGVLIVVGTWMFVSSPQTDQPTQVAQGDDGNSVDGIGWGWASESGVPKDISGSDYLAALAQGAASWGKKTPADMSGLQKRLAEFRAGCNRLANMEHAALSSGEASWLVKSCNEWVRDLDRLIASGSVADFDSVKAQADALALRMESSLKQRAGV